MSGKWWRIRFKTRAWLAGRLAYHLSKCTAIYGALGRMKNSGVSAVALQGGDTVGAE